MSEWISVKERLPDYREGHAEYLISTNTNYRRVAIRDQLDGVWLAEKNQNEVKDSEITHWMVITPISDPEPEYEECEIKPYGKQGQRYLVCMRKDGGTDFLDSSADPDFIGYRYPDDEGLIRCEAILYRSPEGVLCHTLVEDRIPIRPTHVVFKRS